MAGLRYGVELRAAVAGDGAELARLLSQAGWAVSPADVAGRVEGVRQSGAVLVATGWQGLSGVVAVGWGAVLQGPRPVARLTALVVDAGERRHGIGRMLLKAAAQAARVAGCEVMEAEAGGAEGFFLASGFAGAGALVTRSLRRQAG